MSKQTQALLTNAMSVARKTRMTPHEVRKQERLKRALNFKDNNTHKTSTAKVLEAVKQEGVVNYLNIENYLLARWGVSLSRIQIYRIVYKLRKQGKLKDYSVDIEVTYVHTFT